MDLEQERGITIKLTPVRMQWKWYEFNLIDTPGHVDFQYEVSRSLAAVEGAILLVDASQGIQAQTLSVLYAAMEHDLTIIPVLNKIDLPAADPARRAEELEKLIGCDADDIIAVSAKTGNNVEAVLDAVIKRIDDPDTYAGKYPQHLWKNSPSWSPRPADTPLAEGGQATRALIFDSVYDPYKGVVSYVKMVQGELRADQKVDLIYSHTTLEPTEVGHFTPRYVSDKILSEGQIGYVVTGQKSVRDAKIGDTMLGNYPKKKGENLTPLAVPGFQVAKPFIFAGIYPIETSDYPKLVKAMEKLTLNDSAVSYEPESSTALGQGFRCGFLGTLHMDIVSERLRREFGMETIFTLPTVTYLVRVKQYKSVEKIESWHNVKELVASWLYKHIVGDHPEDDLLSSAALVEKYQEQLRPWLSVHSGGETPENGLMEEIREPWAKVEIVGPDEYAGAIMSLVQDYRWVMQGMEYLDTSRVVWRYDMPMGEMIVDFYDKLKSSTKGYATMNYDFWHYQADDLCKLDIYVHGDVVESLSMIVHKDKAYYTGKNVVESLKELIPKHLFPIPLQAGVGGKMIARETIPAMRKDVIAKCYGWDISRKRKLLEKQKEGKKKMKAMGKVNVPNDLFIKMLKR